MTGPGPCAHAPDPRAAEVADQLRRARVAAEGRDQVEAQMHLNRADAIASEMAAEATAAAAQAPPLSDEKAQRLRGLLSPAAAAQAPACEVHGLPMLPSGHTFVCPACQAAVAATEQQQPQGLALDDPPTLARAASLFRAAAARASETTPEPGLGYSPYYRAVRDADEQLDAVLRDISRAYDEGEISAREAADNRVAVHELHADQVRHLRVAFLGMPDPEPEA